MFTFGSRGLVNQCDFANNELKVEIDMGTKAVYFQKGQRGYGGFPLWNWDGTAIGTNRWVHFYSNPCASTTVSLWQRSATEYGFAISDRTGHRTSLILRQPPGWSWQNYFEMASNGDCTKYSGIHTMTFDPNCVPKCTVIVNGTVKARATEFRVVLSDQDSCDETTYKHMPLAIVHKLRPNNEVLIREKVDAKTTDTKFGPAITTPCESFQYRITFGSLGYELDLDTSGKLNIQYNADYKTATYVKVCGDIAASENELMVEINMASGALHFRKGIQGYGELPIRNWDGSPLDMVSDGWVRYYSEPGQLTSVAIWQHSAGIYGFVIDTYGKKTQLSIAPPEGWSQNNYFDMAALCVRGGFPFTHLKGPYYHDCGMIYDGDCTKYAGIHTMTFDPKCVAKCSVIVNGTVNARASEFRIVLGDQDSCDETTYKHMPMAIVHKLRPANEILIREKVDAKITDKKVGPAITTPCESFQYRITFGSSSYELDLDTSGKQTIEYKADYKTATYVKVCGDIAASEVRFDCKK
ncbi:unnamed protein product, partial [Mesorhabditis spiculigera]